MLKRKCQDVQLKSQHFEKDRLTGVQEDKTLTTYRLVMSVGFKRTSSFGIR